MRLRFFMAATCVALCAGVAARADSSITQAFTANGTGDPIASTSFSQFDTSDGTLNSITFSLSGSFTTDAPYSTLAEVAPGSNSLAYIGEGYGGTSTGGSVVAMSSSGTVPLSDFSYFEGTGTQDLLLEFTSEATTFGTTGSITYNYTPAAPINPAPPAATPEPSSIALLGTGLLGLAGVVRKRFA